MTNAFFNKIHYLIFREIEKRGYNIVVITSSKIIYKYYKKRKIQTQFIKPMCGTENISKYEKKYNFSGVPRNQMFLDELAHFLACVRGEAEPMMDARVGSASLRMALAANESLNHRKLVTL